MALFMMSITPFIIVLTTPTIVSQIEVNTSTIPCQAVSQSPENTPFINVRSPLKKSMIPDITSHTTLKTVPNPVHILLIRYSIRGERKSMSELTSSIIGIIMFS